LKNKINIKSNQTLLDISVQETGTVESVVDFVLENNVSITQVLIAGNEILVPVNAVNNVEILNYYKKENILPATGETYVDGNVLFENGLFENGLFQ